MRAAPLALAPALLLAACTPLPVDFLPGEDAAIAADAAAADAAVDGGRPCELPLGPPPMAMRQQTPVGRDAQAIAVHDGALYALGRDGVVSRITNGTPAPLYAATTGAQVSGLDDVGAGLVLAGVGMTSSVLVRVDGCDAMCSGAPLSGPGRGVDARDGLHRFVGDELRHVSTSEVVPGVLVAAGRAGGNAVVAYRGASMVDPPRVGLHPDSTPVALPRNEAVAAAAATCAGGVVALGDTLVRVTPTGAPATVATVPGALQIVATRDLLFVRRAGDIVRVDPGIGVSGTVDTVAAVDLAADDGHLYALEASGTIIAYQ